MANYTTSADLLEDIIFRAGEPASGSDFAEAALRYLNRAYISLSQGGSELDPTIQETWWWLRKNGRGSIILLPIVETGTIAVTNNNATATLSAVSATDLDGWYLKVEGHPDVFRVSAHTAGSAVLTLDSVYTGTTAATASYRLFKLEYDLPTDCIYITGPMRGYREGNRFVHYIDETKMDSEWPIHELQTGFPHNFTMIDDKKVRFSHAGSTGSTDLIRLDFSYVYGPADLANDTAEPLVPRQYRKILADWALALLFEDIQDDRVTDALGLAKSGLQAMARENRRRMRITDSFHAIIRTRPTNRQGRGVTRTESGHILG